MSRQIVIYSSASIACLLSNWCILQIVNHGKILKIRVRGIKQDLTQDTSSEEVCIVMPGVVARFDGSDIKVLEVHYARFQ